MTVPAAAPGSGPIAPAAPRAAPQPPADRSAFAGVLDSLPGAPAKAGGPAAEEQLPSSNESPQDKASRGETARHWSLNDSALLASLPFALRAASKMDERSPAAGKSPPLAQAAKSEDSGASIAGGVKAATVGRLVGERAFHLGASTFGGVVLARTLAVNASASASAVGASLTPQGDPKGESALVAGLARDEAAPAKVLADAVSPLANANAPAPIAPRAGAHPTNRVSATRASAFEAVRSGRQPEGSVPPAVARVASSATPSESGANAKETEDRPLDPIAFAAPSTAQTNPFGAPSFATFAGASFLSDSSTAGAADTNAAPRPIALAAGSASSAPPIREIDVDLSPGGLEDVSMTMRLAGDKLSVVIRAASSQTLGSIEGARDAIADRVCAFSVVKGLVRRPRGNPHIFGDETGVKLTDRGVNNC